MPRRFDVWRWFTALLLLCLPACGSEAAPADGPPAAEAGQAVPSTPEAAPPSADGAARAPAQEAEVGPRVVFLGTSLTAGLGLRRPEERWPERLGRMADSAGMAVTVVNAGRSGDTSAGGLARLDWILQDPVDVLVVELGANDGLRGQPTSALADNLRAVIDRTHGAWPDARVLLVGMEAPTNLGAEYTDRFREVFHTVARERRVDLVPFLLDGVAGVPELNQPDRIHPTAQGHERMARTVWPHLEAILQTIVEGTS